MATAIESLSYGLRINGVKDDAAGLSMSISMNAQIQAVQKSIQNNTDWISLFQIALTNAINAEFDETGVIASVDDQGRLVLTAEDGRNIEFTTTGFGGAFAGGADHSTLVTGGNIRILSHEGFTCANNLVGGQGNDQALGGNSTNVLLQIFKDNDTTVSSYNISTLNGVQRTLDVIGFAIDDVYEMRAEFGAFQNRLESTVANLQVNHENLSAARSRITDADFA
ncbi:MAG: hypothetical protein CMH49_10505, partial [Myxococcales bacterium]|nr:hypothetical protein [Myxococcales bacterium]